MCIGVHRRTAGVEAYLSGLEGDEEFLLLSKGVREEYRALAF